MEEREPFTEVKLAKAVRIPTVVLVVFLAMGAFVVSFDALKDLATIAGIPHPYLFPLIVDGLIVVATFAAVSLDKLLPKATWYPWATLLLFAALSIWGNALHAAQYADTGKIDVTTAAIVSAIPPVSLLLASHLLVLMVQSTTVAALKKKPTPKTVPVAARKVTPVLENVAPIRKPAKDQQGDDIQQLANRIIEFENKGRKVTGADVPELLGKDVSERTGRRKLEAARLLLEQRMHPETVGGGAL